MDRTNFKAYLLIFIATAGIFILDVLSPVGYAIWLAYLFPLWMASRVFKLNKIVAYAGLCSILTLVDLIYFKPGAHFYEATFNRLFGICVLILMAVFMVKRRKAEDAIEKSRDYYRLLFEEFPTPVWQSGPDTKCGFFNKSWLEFTGRTMAQELGDGWAEGVHPDDLADCLNIYSSSFMERRKFRMEYRLRNRAGEYRTIMDVGSPFYDMYGEFRGYIGFVLDMTQERRTGEALRKSESELKEAQHLAQIGNWSWDIENNTTSWSEELYNIFGMDANEAPPNYDGSPRIYTPESSSRLDDTVRRALKTGEAYELELEVNRPDGANRWVTARGKGVKDSSGRVVRLYGTIQDITERKISGEALRELGEKLQILVEEALVGAYIIRERRFVFVNRRTCEILGYSMEELLGLKDMLEIVHPDDREMTTENMRRRLEGEARAVRYEIRLLRKDGKTVLVEALGSVTVYKGKPSIVGSLIDITERREAEAREITERKKLEQQKTDFYAMVTHDLKSPLTVILGYTQLLTIGNRVEDDTREMISVIHDSAEKVNSLVESFLTISKTEAGKMTLDLSPTDVPEVLREAGRGFEKAFKSRGLSFKMEMADGMPKALLDRKLVQRAVSNLLQNAANYTPRGGEITMKAEPVTEKGGDFIVVSVVDSGKGIPAEEREIVFEKYYRSPRTAGIKGTGLGLAIVKAVAEAHGGRVELSSEPGTGSNFKLFLPIH